MVKTRSEQVAKLSLCELENADLCCKIFLNGQRTGKALHKIQSILPFSHRSLLPGLIDVIFLVVRLAKTGGSSVQSVLAKPCLLSPDTREL